MEEQVLNWYVLYVQGGQEVKIAEFLNKNENFTAFNPQIEFIHRMQGRCHHVKKSMFPSYIFVKSYCKMSEFQNYLKQKQTERRGIIRELHYEKGIPSLTEKEIIMMENLMNENAVIEKSSGMINGEQLVIEEGPLKGYESNIVHINRHKRKATLSFYLLGKEVRLDVALEIVKKIE